nr:thiamine phosphate synthase [uncultured Flavobacterium sp.]
MIVITSPIPIPNEISIIHSLFAEGLSLLHVRKPDFTAMEMSSFLAKIKLEFRDCLVLHSHHYLAEDFGVNRLHFSEEKAKILNLPIRLLKPVISLSASVHSIEDFNVLKNEFDYAFLSPVYPSISKPGYSSKINHFEAVKQRTNFSTELIALGGISAANVQTTLENGFDDVALLGTLWNSNNPLENFKICQQAVLSF